MDVAEAFNPLDVLAAAAAWQSANQNPVHHTDSDIASTPILDSAPILESTPIFENHESPQIVLHERSEETLVDVVGVEEDTAAAATQGRVYWRAPPFPDHSYASVPRDPNAHEDLDDALDDVDAGTAPKSPVTEAERSADLIASEADEPEAEGQLFIVLDEDSLKATSLSEGDPRVVEENRDVDDVKTQSDVGDRENVIETTDESSNVDSSSTDVKETNNNSKKFASPDSLIKDENVDVDTVLNPATRVSESDSKLFKDFVSESNTIPDVKNDDILDIKDVHNASIALDCAPKSPVDTRGLEQKIDVKTLESSVNKCISIDTGIPGDIIPKTELPSACEISPVMSEALPGFTSSSVVSDMTRSRSLIDPVLGKLQKRGVFVVRTTDSLLADKLVSPHCGRSQVLVSPPSHHPGHTCVSLDCCSPSDISTCVSRDLCVDRLSSASSQDLYTDDLDSPRGSKMVVSPPRERKRRQSRGLYHIPLGPLLDDAKERPEHPLKDHDYCLHSFYLAVTHNRQDEPLRRPGPAPKCKETMKMRKKYEKKSKKKRRSSDYLDMPLYKEEVFSDTDSVNLDSPCKSGKSSPTNSLTSSLDLSRDRAKIRDKRLCSLPNMLEKTKEKPSSNFNDNFFFFGKKPKRRNRTVVENNHDKLKKFNHSEFLPGLDIGYLEARAKFHKKVDSVEPDAKSETTDQELSQDGHPDDVSSHHPGTDMTPTVLNSEFSIPKGGLAYGITEEESHFIDSLHCQSMETDSFHSNDEITHEQVKELLTVVGVDNAMKLIEDTGLNENSLGSELNENNVSSDSLHMHQISNQEQSSVNETASQSAELNSADTLAESSNSVELKDVSSIKLDLTSTSNASPEGEELKKNEEIAANTNASRPNSLPISPQKINSDQVSDLRTDLSTTGHDFSEHLGSTDLPETSLLGGTTPELHIGNVSDLGATTPELPFGGTTPHDLLDLDDTDLLNANLNLNMNSLLNFQSPEKVYHPNGASRPIVPGPAQRKLDLDVQIDKSLSDTQNSEMSRSYIRNNPLTLGKPDQMLKSQMFKNLSELENDTSEDHGVPELITVNMFWNDLPGLLINGTQYVRLVDIHKQVLPAKPTGLLKNRCKALNMEIRECTELQRDFLIRYAHAAASRSQIIVSKEVAETLIGYYVENRPGKKMDDFVGIVSDSASRSGDVIHKSRKSSRKERYESKPRGRPKGSIGSSNVSVKFKLGNEVFHKRVQTCGFSLLDAGDSSDDGDTDPEDRLSSQAHRFQKILHLRNQIKMIRSEIYAIQKRQQRAAIRKSKGIIKRRRLKPRKKLMLRCEPKRIIKTLINSVGKGRFRSVPTVRVRPSVDKTRSVSPSSRYDDSSSKPSPSVLVQPISSGNVLPSAIVTPLSAAVSPLSSRLDSGVISVEVSPESTVIDVTKTDPNDEKSVMSDDDDDDGDDSDNHLIVTDESAAAVYEDLIVDPSAATSSNSVVPSFRCSTPSDLSKGGVVRLGVQHYSSTSDCQNGYLYVNMFVASKSSCIRCATCFQLMTVVEFVNHLHSSDDGATLIKHAITKPRHLIIQDRHLLSAHQASLWEQLQHKTSAGLSPVRQLKKDSNSSKRKLNVQLSRVGRTKTVNHCEEKLEPERVKPPPVRERRSFPSALPQEPESSRYSGRVRKRKTFSPDEGYSLPKIVPKVMKKSRSESLLSKRASMLKLTPLASSSYGRPVCKVSPRPVAKISPSVHSPNYKSSDRHRSRVDHR